MITLGTTDIKRTGQHNKKWAELELNAQYANAPWV